VFRRTERYATIGIAKKAEGGSIKESHSGPNERGMKLFGKGVGEKGKGEGSRHAAWRPWVNQLNHDLGY